MPAVGTASRRPHLANALLWWSTFAIKHSFLVGMACAILLAVTKPSLGAKGGPLKPEVTVDGAATALLFVLSGLGLGASSSSSFSSSSSSASEAHAAAGPGEQKKGSPLLLLGLVQGFSLGVLPCAVMALTHAARRTSAAPAGRGGGGGGGGWGFEAATLDGLVVMACVPTTASMCVVLSSTHGGDTSAALLNAVVGNVVGIAVTPWLLAKGLSRPDSNIAIPFLPVLRKLVKKVLLPVAAGALLGARCGAVQAMRQAHKRGLAKLSEALLLTVVYAAFCDTLHGHGGGHAGASGVAAAASSVAASAVVASAAMPPPPPSTGPRGSVLAASQLWRLALLLPALHLAAAAALFALATQAPGLRGRLNRPQVVTALYCGSQKTVALGVPLIKAILSAADRAAEQGAGGAAAAAAAGSPASASASFASLSAPLLLYHPLQLLLGSLLGPALGRYAQGGEGGTGDDDDDGGATKRRRHELGKS